VEPGIGTVAVPCETASDQTFFDNVLVFFGIHSNIIII